MLADSSKLCLMVLMLLAIGEECLGDIVIERSEGVTPDRFTLTGDSCNADTNCSSHIGREVEGGSRCQCRCRASASTFAAESLMCIQQSAGCLDLAFSNIGSQIFTFTIVDSELYPKLPVTLDLPSNNTELLDCDRERLVVQYQSESGWKTLQPATFALVTDPSINNTYLQIQEVSDKVQGKLVKVSYECRDTESTSQRCIALKIQGFQKVAMISAVTSSQTTTIKKLNITPFYWVAGGCIAALIIAAMLGLAVACRCRTNHKREERIRVRRLDKNGNYASDSNHPTRKISRKFVELNGDVPDTPATNGKHTRKPMFIKNPNRNNYYQTRQNTPMPSRGMTSSQDDNESPRPVTPRTPRPTSQNSATFVVNETDPQMMHRLPTDNPDNLENGNHKNNKKVEKVIEAAKTALTDFEGSRLPPTTPRQQNVLFNPAYEGLSRVQVSIKGITDTTSPTDKQKDGKTTKSRKRRKAKEADDFSFSKLSIDYKHFDLPTESSQASSGESTNTSDGCKPINTPPDVTIIQTSTGLLQYKSPPPSLNEYNIDDSLVMTSEHFHRINSNPGSTANNLNNSAGQATNDGNNSLATSPRSKGEVTFHRPDQHVPATPTSGLSQVTLPYNISERPDSHSTPYNTNIAIEGESFQVNGGEDSIPITNIDDLINSSDLPPPPNNLLSTSTSLGSAN